ncbi:MAG: hypothetical protein OES26_18050 [Gammaproteobacteria bacterium]|nr:hypothetical protein [Gammaproteobacteria bacterium]
MKQIFRDKEIPFLILAQGLESGRSVDGIAKVYDLPFIVSYFAGNDRSSMHACPKSWHHTKRRFVARRLGSDEILYVEHALQTSGASGDYRKRLSNDDLITNVAVGFASVLSDGPCDVKEKTTYERLYPYISQLLAT